MFFTAPPVGRVITVSDFLQDRRVPQEIISQLEEEKVLHKSHDSMKNMAFYGVHPFFSLFTRPMSI